MVRDNDLEGQPVGDLADSGTTRRPPSEPEPVVPPHPRPNDLLDALIDKLGVVSGVWTDTFPPTPKGYAKLQMLIARYSYDALRGALEAALSKQIVPKSANALPLLTALTKQRMEP